MTVGTQDDKTETTASGFFKRMWEERKGDETGRRAAGLSRISGRAQGGELISRQSLFDCGRWAANS